MTNSCFQLAELLLEQGADPNIQDVRMKFTALHMACRLGHLELVELLLKKGRWLMRAVWLRVYGERWHVRKCPSRLRLFSLYRALASQE